MMWWLKSVNTEVLGECTSQILGKHRQELSVIFCKKLKFKCKTYINITVGSLRNHDGDAEDYVN